MAKLVIGGRELKAVRMNRARTRDVIELQNQSGMTLKEMHDKAKAADTLSVAIMSFLTRANAGMEPKWADLIDGPLEDLGKYVPEPGDTPAAKEAEADPQTEASVTREAERAVTIPLGDGEVTTTA